MATSGSTDKALAEIEAEELRLRLAALEADMASSRKERVSREELLRRYACNGPVDAGPPPAEGSFSWKIQQAQQRRREHALRHAERVQKAHDELLAKNAKAIERVEAECSQLEERARAELERHQQAMEAIGKDRVQLARKLDDLQAVPTVEPEPDPNAVEVMPFYRGIGGRAQYAPRHVVEAAHAARQRGLTGADVTKYLIETGVVDASDYGLRATSA